MSDTEDRLVDLKYHADTHTIHAVRWSRRKSLGEQIWTKWHITIDASHTLCNQIIPIGLADPGTFLPETDDIDRSNCKLCLRAWREASKP
jgi:hypothetical protein